MKKMFFVCAFVVAMFSSTIAWAETPVMEVSDKSQTVAEYNAICTTIGGEPDLRDVTVEQYLDVCNRWVGHRVIAAERVWDGQFVVDDKYWTSPITTCSTGHMEGEYIIRAVDDNGNEFKYYCLEQ